MLGDEMKGKDQVAGRCKFGRGVYTDREVSG